MAALRGWLWRVVAEIVHRLRQHDLMMMAAAIAFYWVLGLIPLLLFGASALGYLVGSSDLPVDNVIAAASRLMPRATSLQTTKFLQELIRSRHVTGVLGIGSLFWFAMGAFEWIFCTAITLLPGGIQADILDSHDSPGIFAADPMFSAKALKTNPVP